MVWSLWRQHRAQALSVAGIILALGVYLLAAREDARPVLGWLPVLPLLVGIFWGAPLLAREFERGTHRLAWTQSVTRLRWLSAKLGWLGLAVAVAGLVVGWMVSTWVADIGGNRFGDAEFFGATGVAGGAWWLFAFLLGAASGALLRRLLPALAVTVALFVLVLFAMIHVREDYAQPLRGGPEMGATDGLVTGGAWLAPSGEEVAEPPVCADADPNRYLDCVHDAGYRDVVYYQPASRYWRFQWTEAGILLLGAALLVAPVAYRVLKRPV
jgi:hypothetical protein